KSNTTGHRSIRFSKPGMAPFGLPRAKACAHLFLSRTPMVQSFPVAIQNEMAYRAIGFVVFIKPLMASFGLERRSEPQALTQMTQTRDSAIKGTHRDCAIARPLRCVRTEMATSGWLHLVASRESSGGISFDTLKRTAW